MSPSVYLSSPIFITGMNASASIDRTASIVLDIFSLALYSRSNSSMHSNLVVLSPKSANGVDFFLQSETTLGQCITIDAIISDENNYAMVSIFFAILIGKNHFTA